MGVLPVITTFFNYVGSQRKVELICQLKKAAKKWKNAKLYIVEVSYNGVFQVTNDYNKCHFQLHAKEPFFHKENLINYVARHILEEYPYFAWMDSDLDLEVDFDEIMLQLDQPIPVVLQPWSVVHDLGPNGELYSIQPSFLKDKKAGHIGYFWAMNKICFKVIGGLFDIDLTGTGDYIFVSALLSQRKKGSEFQRTHSKAVSEEYLEEVKAYEGRFTGVDYGYLEGKITHKYHGDRGKRNYYSRCKILKEYVPIRDLEINQRGLIKCVNADINERLKDYFLSREE